MDKDHTSDLSPYPAISILHLLRRHCHCHDLPEEQRIRTLLSDYQQQLWRSLKQYDVTVAARLTAIGMLFTSIALLSLPTSARPLDTPTRTHFALPAIPRYLGHTWARTSIPKTVTYAAPPSPHLLGDRSSLPPGRHVWISMATTMTCISRALLSPYVASHYLPSNWSGFSTYLAGSTHIHGATARGRAAHACGPLHPEDFCLSFPWGAGRQTST